MADEDLTAELMAMAAAAGAVAGVGEATALMPERAGLLLNLSRGWAGPLGFTYQDPVTATDVTLSFPWARSMVVVGHDYLDEAATPSPTGPVIARFATQDHYRQLRRVTGLLSARLIELGYRAEVLVDDNRLVDRAAAVTSGIGWRGKSTMVLSPGSGPWLLLGTVVTDAALAPHSAMQRTCGRCVACLPACPTGALDGQHLDARRCLATWLQTPGSLPQWIRPRLGRRIYGCDECLLACPPGHRRLRLAGEKPQRLTFAELLGLSDAQLVDRFPWWFIPRRDGRYLRRNLLVAAGNSGEPEARVAVEAHLHHPSSMIRGHAYWALARGFGAAAQLRSALAAETVPEAIDELTLALMMVEDPLAHHLVLAADEWAAGESAVKGLAVVPGDVAGGSRPRLLGWIEGDLHSHFDAAEVRGFGDDGEPFVRVYDPERKLEGLRRAAAWGGGSA